MIFSRKLLVRRDNDENVTRKVLYVLFDDLHDVFVIKDVFLAHFLWTVLHRRSPHQRTVKHTHIQINHNFHTVL
jgi:hypothetical protein